MSPVTVQRGGSASSAERSVDLVLGIDIGTGSTKGVLTTPDGAVVATAVRTHAMSLPRPSWAEVDAERVWWDDLVEVARELTAGLDGRPLAGMCVSGVGPCLLVCDGDTVPVRPAILYGIDGRAERRDRRADRRSSAPRRSWSGAARCSARRPSARRCCGSAATSRRSGRAGSAGTTATPTSRPSSPASTSSTTTPRASATRSTTSAGTLGRRLGAGRRRGPRDAAAGLSARGGRHGDRGGGRGRRESRGAPRSSPGTVDAWAEAFSAGARKPGDLMLMYGSTMFFVAGAHALPDPPEAVDHRRRGARAAHRRGRHVDVRLAHPWVQELPGGVSFDQLVAEAGQVPPGSDGLLVLPYFAGERTPIFDPHARGVVAGLTLTHGRGHLFRAAYEGIAYGVTADRRLPRARRRPDQAHRGRRRRHPGRPLDPDRQRRHRPRPARAGADHRRLLRRRAARRHRQRPRAPGDRLGRRGLGRPDPAPSTASSTTGCTRGTGSCTRRPRTSSTTSPRSRRRRSGAGGASLASAGDQSRRRPPTRHRRAPVCGSRSAGGARRRRGAPGGPR